MKFPLLKETHIPTGAHQGAFGARRRHDVHTGVDLYATDGDLVVAVESGRVVAVENFTGPSAGSPWWLETMSLLVEGPSGVICYGEIATNHGVGDIIHEGMIIGEVRRVLRRDKGLPTAMLHFELYKPGTKKSVVWNLDEEWPEGLCNPTHLLFEARMSQGRQEEKIESRHGHDYDYNTNCLLCCPPHKESQESPTYITLGILFIVALMFGFANFLLGGNAGTLDAFLTGLGRGMMVSIGLLSAAVALAAAGALLIGIAYFFGQVYTNTSRYLKYLYLRFIYGGDSHDD